jgi:hypothetical protein
VALSKTDLKASRLTEIVGSHGKPCTAQEARYMAHEIQQRRKVAQHKKMKLMIKETFKGAKSK